MATKTEHHQNGGGALEFEPPLASQPTDELDSPTATLEGLSEELKTQGRGIRRTQQAFTIFAAMALLIAVVNIIAVAAKLGSNDKATSAAAPAAAKASAPPAPLSHKANVALKEFSVTPSVTQAAAGRVSFHVHNAGAITHEFVVIRTPKAAGDLLQGARADESGNVGETGDLRAGQSKNLTLNLKPGHY